MAMRMRMGTSTSIIEGANYWPTSRRVFAQSSAKPGLLVDVPLWHLPCGGFTMTLPRLAASRRFL